MKTKEEMLNVEIGQPVEISVTGKLSAVRHDSDGVIYQVELKDRFGKFVGFASVTRDMIIHW